MPRRVTKCCSGRAAEPEKRASRPLVKMQKDPEEPEHRDMAFNHRRSRPYRTDADEEHAKSSAKPRGEAQRDNSYPLACRPNRETRCGSQLCQPTTGAATRECACGQSRRAKIEEPASRLRPSTGRIARARPDWEMTLAFDASHAQNAPFLEAHRRGLYWPQRHVVQGRSWALGADAFNCPSHPARLVQAAATGGSR
jgi:hypothetical protein